MTTVMFGIVRRMPMSSMAWWEAPSFAGVTPPWEQAILTFRWGYAISWRIISHMRIDPKAA